MALQLDYANDKGVSFPNAYYRIAEVSIMLSATPTVNLVYKVYKNAAKRNEEKPVYQTTVQAKDHLVSPAIYDNATPPNLVTPAVFANDYTNWFKSGGAGNDDHLVKRGYLFIKSLAEFSAAQDV